MIINTQKLQDISNKILQAVDTDATTAVSTNGDKIELVVENGQLRLNVTNKEYYARVVIDNVPNENLRAVVDAKLFLNLISKLSSNDVELSTTDNFLKINSGGSNYKLPIIYGESEVIKLDEIIINNVTSSFNISSDVLLSILNYNSKELKSDTNLPIQKLFYIDEKGCITFTSGACVNNFTLDQPIKLLLNQKLVKLFKLFKSGEVKFTLGYDEVSQGLIQTKVKFENDEISLTAITSTDNSLLNKFPVDKIRNLANSMLNYQVSLNKNELLSAITRLLLVNASRGGFNKFFGTVEFTPNEVIVYDSKQENKEVITCKTNVAYTYTSTIDINNLKVILDSCVEDEILLNFGNKTCLILSRGNVKNVLPEAHK